MEYSCNFNVPKKFDIICTKGNHGRCMANEQSSNCHLIIFENNIISSIVLLVCLQANFTTVKASIIVQNVKCVEIFNDE